MKKAILFLLVFNLIFSSQSFSQSGQWIWMKGDTLFDVNGYATLFGVEDSTYHPASLYKANSWIDDSGKLWLFGGLRYSEYGSEYNYNFVWQFNPVTNNWARMRGDCCSNTFGEYGEQGVTDSVNFSPAKSGAQLWKDTSNTIWVFGGSNVFGYYNDLWKYNMITNEWTWVKGPDTWFGQGVYGTKGIPADSNNPPPRREAATWIDDSNNLWLFGGFGETPFDESRFFNDLWKYTILTNQWTWMGGTDTLDDPGKYGDIGIPDSTNLPRSRSSSCNWKDDFGNFYLFGGTANESPGEYVLNDLWKYNIKSKEWTWLSGSMDYNANGKQNYYCKIDSNNYPVSRMLSTCQKIDSNRILLFGGYLLWQWSPSKHISRDVWIYNFKENTWSTLWGDSLSFDGYFGEQEIKNPANDARGRHGAVSWWDGNDFWIYGGNHHGFNSTCADLWRYTFDTSCIKGIYNQVANIQPILNQFLIMPNPASDYIKILMPADVVAADVQIITTSGISVFESYISSKTNQIDIRSLKQGIYLIKIVSSKIQITTKLIIVN